MLSHVASWLRLTRLFAERVTYVLFQMDKKRKRQLLQDREDAIAQLYQGTAVDDPSEVSFPNHCVSRSECVSIKEIGKWSQFEPIYEKLQRVMDVEKGEQYCRNAASWFTSPIQIYQKSIQPGLVKIK